jgi:hypothetical protein
MFGGRYWLMLPLADFLYLRESDFMRFLGLRGMNSLRQLLDNIMIVQNPVYYNSDLANVSIILFRMEEVCLFSCCIL